MDRLTERNKKGDAVVAGAAAGATPTEAAFLIPVILARLAAYEDTGLSPEAVAELKTERSEPCAFCQDDSPELLETEKSHARDGFIRCGYVQFAEAFGERLKPYEGCPRGAEGLKGFMPGQEPGRIAAVIGYLVDARGNVLVGSDEDYICVPKMWYDRCLTNLRGALKGGAAV